MVEQTFQQNKLKPDFSKDIFSQIASFEEIKARGNFAEGLFVLQKTPNALRGHRYGIRCIESAEPFPTMCIVFHFFAIQPENEILKLPVRNGAKWVGTFRHYCDIECETTVKSLSETIVFKDKTFTNCLKLKTIISAYDIDHTEKAKRERGFICGERTMWFAKGVGLVKLHYAHVDGAETEIELLDVSLAKEEDEYLPLSVGNQWTYRWTNSYREHWIQEICTVAAKDGDAYAIECAARYVEPKANEQQQINFLAAKDERGYAAIECAARSAEPQQINLLLDKDLYNSFVAASKRVKKPISVIMEEALKEYLAKR